MGTRLICRLATLAVVVLAVLYPPAAAAAAGQDTVTASGGRSDMLFVAGAGLLMLVAVGALAAAQSRGHDAGPGPEAPGQQDPHPDV